MKTLNLNLRRVRTSTRTDVTTGSRIKLQSGGAGYACPLPSAAMPEAPSSKCLAAQQAK